MTELSRCRDVQRGPAAHVAAHVLRRPVALCERPPVLIYSCSSMTFTDCTLDIRLRYPVAPPGCFTEAIEDIRKVATDEKTAIERER